MIDVRQVSKCASAIGGNIQSIFLYSIHMREITDHVKYPTLLHFP